jgi:ABC-type multidrug transport system fused ATPase/permease subunit
MEQQSDSFFQQYKELLEQHLLNRMRLLQLQAVKKMAALSAGFTLITMLAMLSFLVMMSASIMLGFWLAGPTGSVQMGFACVTIFYLLIVILIFLFRRQLQKKIMDQVINSLLEEKPENDETTRL